MTDAHGRDHVTDAEMALSADGKILGLRVKTTANMGAYLSTFAPAVPTYPLRHAAQRRVHDRRPSTCEVTGVFTQHDRRWTPTAAPGGRKPRYVLERMVEVAARRAQDGCGRDPPEELHPEVLRRVPDARSALVVRQRRLRAARSTRRCRCSTTRSSARSRRPRASRAGCSASGSRPTSRRAGSRRRKVVGALGAGAGLYESRQGAGPSDRRGHRLHRLALARPGPRDDVLADRRRRARHPDGGGRDRPRRHRRDPVRHGHLRQPLRLGRRHRDLHVARQDQGEGQEDRGASAGGLAEATSSTSAASSPSRARRARPCRSGPSR